MMASLPSNNLLTSSGNILEMILIPGKKQKSAKRFKASLLSALEVSLVRSMTLSASSGISSRSTLTNTMKDAKDSWMKRTSKSLSLKFWKKPPRENSTTSSGTYSELTLTPTRKSTSLNSYLFFDTGTLHPEPCRLNRPPKVPQAADQRKELPLRRWTLYCLLERILLPLLNAKEERRSLHNLQTYFKRQQPELRSLYELD